MCVCGSAVSNESLSYMYRKETRGLGFFQSIHLFHPIFPFFGLVVGGAAPRHFGSSTELPSWVMVLLPPSYGEQTSRHWDIVNPMKL